MDPTRAREQEPLLVLRIRVGEDVFFAPMEAMREEEAGLYAGFGRRRTDQYLPLQPADLLRVQRDLRLCVQLPSDEVVFCDLDDTQPNTDPFVILPQTAQDDAQIWEVLPHLRKTRQLNPQAEQHLTAHSSRWEDVLFTS